MATNNSSDLFHNFNHQYTKETTYRCCQTRISFILILQIWIERLHQIRLPQILLQPKSSQNVSLKESDQATTPTPRPAHSKIYAREDEGVVGECDLSLYVMKCREQKKLFQNPASSKFGPSNAQVILLR